MSTLKCTRKLASPFLRDVSAATCHYTCESISPALYIIEQGQTLFLIKAIQGLEIKGEH